MELAKSIIDLISSGLVLGGIIWGAWKAATFFNYKYDSDIRNLYIENCKKIRSIMGKVISCREADNNDIYQIQTLLQDALIFLHKDIVNYLKNVCDAMISLNCYKIDLEAFYGTDAERKEYFSKHTDAFNRLVDLNKMSFLVYRKHIVKDGLGFDKFKKILDYKYDKN